MKKIDKKYPEGHFVGIWMVIWIAIFIAIGIPLSITTENPGIIGIWPALGVSVGLAIGQGVENKYKKEGKIRPLTKEEEKKNASGCWSSNFNDRCLIIFCSITITNLSYHNIQHFVQHMKITLTTSIRYSWKHVKNQAVFS